jgi:hypothetical protein
MPVKVNSFTHLRALLVLTLVLTLVLLVLPSMVRLCLLKKTHIHINKTLLMHTRYVSISVYIFVGFSTDLPFFLCGFRWWGTALELLRRKIEDLSHEVDIHLYY